MTNYAQMERRLTDVLGLSRRPVAIAFRDTPPEGVLPLSGTQPSGCSFWRLAAGGQVFYTVPSDHFNCSVGCYTHNIALPPEREADLTGTLISIFPVTNQTVLQTNLTLKYERFMKLETNPQALPPEGTAVKLVIDASDTQ